MRNQRRMMIRFLEGMDEGLIDPRQLAQNLLGYMSEEEVVDFARREEYFEEEDEEAAELQ